MGVEGRVHPLVRGILGKPLFYFPKKKKGRNLKFCRDFAQISYKKTDVLGVQELCKCSCERLS